jgi:hypothetical protein
MGGGIAILGRPFPKKSREYAVTSDEQKGALMYRLARRSILFSFLCLLALFNVVPSVRAGEDWLPITPEELKMTSEPKAPGVPAIYLYRQVDRDDAQFHENDYARIKILTEEGRKYANVEIPFVKGFGNIKGIRARTIHPDGSVVNFNGQVFDKMIVKAKGVRVLVKTFTMPDVQPGSIIEYRYERILPEDYLYDSSWLLSEELFTKHAKFSLYPNSRFALKSSWPHGLPSGTPPPVEDHNVYRLEVHDVPAFQIEDYMPPEDEYKYRVDFAYTRIVEMDPDKFWNEEAKRQYRWISLFINKPKAMEQAVAQIIAPSDTPQQKLEKFYARCQSLRNLSFEQTKTEQEVQRENLKMDFGVDEVWKRGYGDRRQIDWLFLALARAAGFEAAPVLVSTRNRYFFNRKLMNADELDAEVVQVKVDGNDLYLSPGVEFAPFGLLPWSETHVTGLRLDKDGGAWILTSLPETSASGVERKATLHIDESGSLEGQATVTFKGLSALGWRIDERDEDETERKKFLEDEFKEYIPSSAEVELTNKPDWNSSSDILVAEYHVKIPEWISAAGHRSLLTVGLFSGTEKHVFDHAERMYPIYYHYPYEDKDDLTIELPPNWQVSGLPKPQVIDDKLCAYRADAESGNNSVHLSRQFTVNMLMLDSKYYGGLRNFYQRVRTEDEQQIVLSRGAAAAQN